MTADALDLDTPPTVPPAPAKAAAKKAAAKPKVDTPPRGPGRPSNDDKLREKVAELYAGLGMLVMLKDPDLALRIMENADELAGSWVKLSHEYPAVAKLLDKLTTVSALGALVAVHAKVFGPSLLATFGPKEGDAPGVTLAETPGETPAPWVEPVAA